MMNRKMSIIFLAAVMVIAAILPVSAYAQEASISQEQILQNQGNVGRLTIPDINISIRLFQSDWTLWQYYTDMEDSGAYIDFWSEYGPYVYDPGYESYRNANNVVLIADHSNQQFQNLFSSYIGCKGYIGRGDNVQEITCYAITSGYNTADGLYMSDWTPAYVNDGYIMYTCAANDGGYSVYITFWH